MRKTLAKNGPVLRAQINQRMQIRELVMAVISAIIKKEGPVATGAAASFRRAAGSLIACGSE